MDEGETSRPWQSYNTVYTNAKAGMDGVDKEKVQRIVYEMSKGSKYFENEERKEAFIQHKISNMRARCALLTSTDISHYQMVADKRILELEAARDLSRIWLHVDMDAFYAAVETLSNPSLKGKPMAVGGMSMISTANYEARKFGVRAAMPGFIARKLCPQLIFVPTDFKKYTHYSSLTRKVFERYDPNFMAASLDEAYLDITKVCEQRGTTGGEIAEEIRRNVYEETGLTCSAGVGPNRLLAKVSSDINKPNGQFVLPNDRMAVMTFISSLPARKIGGIGKVTERVLRDVLEINTCEDMLQKGGLLCALFSHSSSEFFLSVGLGLGHTDTPQVRFRKSISNERTFSPTDNLTLLYGKLEELSEMLSVDMEKEGLSGRTLTLKLKTAIFEIRTRAVTLQRYICSKEDIMNHASKLLKAELPVSLRLIGLRISHFNEEKPSVPSDPTQKRITSFIRDASGKSVGNNRYVGNNSLMFDGSETSLESYNTCHSDSSDLLDSNQLSVQCTSVICSDSCKVGIEANASDLILHSPSYSLNDGSQVVETDSSYPRGFKVNSLGGVYETVNEAGPLSIPSEQPLWVDGFKCLLCGIELPPSFVEERQEHADFHLAEKLQEEESFTNSRNSMMRTINQSFTRRDQTGDQGKPKKRKKESPLAGKHLTIDLFFHKK